MRYLALFFLLTCFSAKAQWLANMDLASQRALQTLEGETEVFIKGDLDEAQRYLEEQGTKVKYVFKDVLVTRASKSVISEIALQPFCSTISLMPSQGTPLISESRKHAKVNGA